MVKKSINAILNNMVNNWNLDYQVKEGTVCYYKDSFWFGNSIGHHARIGRTKAFKLIRETL